MRYLSYEQVVTWLAENRKLWGAVVDATDINRDTLQKIVEGRSKDPGVKKIEAISDFIVSLPTVHAGSGNEQQQPSQVA